MTGTAGGRRRFLEALAAAAASVPLLGGLAAALRAILSSPRVEAEEVVEVCRLEDVPADGALSRPARRRVRRGAFQEEEHRLLLVLRAPKEPHGVAVLLAECTHLGCTVRFDAASGHVLCPCHGGVFAADGSVLEGPPARPLPRLVVLDPGDTGVVRVRFPRPG